jgi:hypothetical protein
MYKKGLFENVEDKKSKQAIIRNIEKDYLSGATLKQISENYSFTERQVRYIINHYLKLNRKDYKRDLKRKEKNMGKNHEVIKVDDDKFLVDDKPAKKATVDDLIKKAKIVKREMKRKSTNIKVENNN